MVSYVLVIDFNAINNIIELTMDQINSKGTEQYWGYILVVDENKNYRTGNYVQRNNSGN